MFAPAPPASIAASAADQRFGNVAAGRAAGSLFGRQGGGAGHVDNPGITRPETQQGTVNLTAEDVSVAEFQIRSGRPRDQHICPLGSVHDMAYPENAFCFSRASVDAETFYGRQGQMVGAPETTYRRPLVASLAGITAKDWADLDFAGITMQLPPAPAEQALQTATMSYMMRGLVSVPKPTAMPIQAGQEVFCAPPTVKYTDEHGNGVCSSLLSGRGGVSDGFMWPTLVAGGDARILDIMFGARAMALQIMATALGPGATADAVRAGRRPGAAAEQQLNQARDQILGRIEAAAADVAARTFVGTSGSVLAYMCYVAASMGVLNDRWVHTSVERELSTRNRVIQQMSMQVMASEGAGGLVMMNTGAFDAAASAAQASQRLGAASGVAALAAQMSSGASQGFVRASLFDGALAGTNPADSAVGGLHAMYLFNQLRLEAKRKSLGIAVTTAEAAATSFGLLVRGAVSV